MRTNTVNTMILVQHFFRATGKTIHDLLLGFALLLILIGLNLVLSGCQKNSIPLENDQPATVEGRVDDQSGAPKNTGSAAGGYTVTVAQVQGDGSLTTVSHAPVETDFMGYYKIEVRVSGMRNLIVVAVKGSETLKAIISAEVKRGLVVKAPPLNARTTVEADVYAQLVGMGKANLVTVADLRSAIDGIVAEQVQGNAMAIAALATVIAVEAEARLEAYLRSEIAVTQQQLDGIRRAQIQAVAALDYALYASVGNPEGARVAFQSFAEAVVRAHVDNGIDIEHYARCRLAALQALIRWSSGFPQEIHFQLQKRAALIGVQLIDRVNQAKFQVLGATSAQMATVVSAGVTLKASIDAATTAQQIVSAFETYHDSIVQVLTSTLSASASAIVGVDAQINGTDGFKAQLQAEVQAATSTQQVVEAYRAYYQNVKTAVLNAMPGTTEVQVQAVTVILVLINIF